MQYKDLQILELEVISKDSPRTQIIIISDEKDLDLAVDGIRAGAYQYMVQPINEKELHSLIKLERSI